MKFKLELDDGGIHYGHDHALGWWGERRTSRGKVLETYDGISRNYNRERPLRGLLLWMSGASGLFTEMDLNETLERLAHEDSSRLPRRLQLVGGILRNARAAGE